MVFVAVIAGVVAGLLGFLPLFIGLRLTRLANTSSIVGNMGVLMFGVFVSMAVLIVSAVACIKLARDLTLPFVLAEGISLCVVAIVYGIVKMVRK